MFDLLEDRSRSQVNSNSPSSSQTSKVTTNSNVSMSFDGKKSKVLAKDVCYESQLTLFDPFITTSGTTMQRLEMSLPSPFVVLFVVLGILGLLP